jgi:hypothetical protein
MMLGLFVDEEKNRGIQIDRELAQSWIYLLNRHLHGRIDAKFWVM